MRRPAQRGLTIALAALAASCDRATTSKTVPVSAAYGDGFEVVVFDLLDGAPSNARALRLAEAERAIAAGAHVALPGDVAAIERQLSTGRSGDSRARLVAEQGGRRVRLSFHEGNRTFLYEYRVEGSRIVPLASSHRDLGKSNETRYSRE